MKLRYKILWIEDDIKTIKIKAKNTRKFLEENYGFECKEDDIEILNYDEFKEQYIQNNEVKSDMEKFDLLLVDFDLGEVGKSGDELIEIIRKGLYSEILFYSSNYPALKTSLQSKDIDGVFTSNRGELEYKIKKLIRVTIKKVQDVNNLRGLIMAEVSELERLKEKIIIKASPKIDQKNLEKYVLKKIQSSGNSTKNKATGLLNDIDNVLFEDLFKKIGFIDMDKKIHATGEILDKLKITSPISKTEFIEPYKENIRDIRNKFAHIEECDGKDEDGNGCKVIGDIPFTESNCIKIRQEIKKYKKILEDIELQV